MSVLRKAELRDRLSAVRKAFDKQTKEKEAAALKEAVDGLQQYFKDNESAQAYIAAVNVDGNVKALGTIVTQGKKLDKAVYVFSSDGSKLKAFYRFRAFLATS